MRYLINIAKLFTLMVVVTLMAVVTPAAAQSSKAAAPKAKPVTFVMQMTVSEDIQQRRAFMQIAKVLEDLGPDKVKIEVVAYEGGILSLLTNNASTAGLVASLHRQGVKFKACRISMRASDLAETDFPLEVEFVPAGAPEMIRLQLQGARYWRP